MSSHKIITFADAIREGIIQSLKKFPNMYLMGEGVNDPSSMWGTIKGIDKLFGENRVLEMPVSENGMFGLAIGSAIQGSRPLINLQRVEFALYAFEQIINNAAKSSYISRGKHKVPLVVRMVIGRGWGQGPQHAKTLHSMFSYLPGLTTVMPSSPSEAKGLLLSSIMSNDPVIFLEYRTLWNTKELVPTEKYYIDLDKPRVRLKGDSLTMVAAGGSVLTALKAAEILYSSKGVKCDLIDLRSISNMKLDVVLESVRKTKRLVVIEDGWKSLGYSAEIIAKVSEANINLKSAPQRVCWPTSHVPMSTPLEKDFYFDEHDVVKACISALNE